MDLERCIQAYSQTIAPAHIYIERDHPCCGAAWIAGAEKASRDGYDYLHLTADDLEPDPGWSDAAIETIDANCIPAPLIHSPGGGGLESAGLENFGAYTGTYDDWQMVNGTTIPFLSREMWDRMCSLPGFVDTLGATHYATDLAVSWTARYFGWETVIRTNMRFTHYTATPGRNYNRAADDTRIFLAWADQALART
jgi:hypothetical protein